MNNFSQNLGFERKEYLNEILRYVDKPIIKVIIGLRRSGKSFLLRQLIQHLVDKKGILENDLLYIDREMLEFDFLKNYTDLYAFVKAKKPRYLFLDEVQEIKSWEKAIASFHKEGIDVTITGSNAKMLSSDLATHLAGRYVQIPIYTLSFLEFTTLHGKAEKELSSLFQDYLKTGGFPVLFEFGEDERARYTLIRDILQTIILKDIVVRQNLRNIHLLENIIRYTVDNIGKPFSAKKVADYLKSQHIRLSVETVYEYLRYLTATYALHAAKRYDIRGKRHLEISEKYYLGDLGLRHALLGYRKNDIECFLENVVFLELLRRGYHVSIGKMDHREIDFVAEKREERLYIQVCYLIATREVFEREFTPLHAVKDSSSKWVLSMDPPLFGHFFEGVYRQNLMDWLLKKPLI